ncbi:voltage-dependent anion channel [Xylariaceae sp. FL1272]|nr:voltage-dependent anion channel [Xylariaceae sp. FL1272]
MDHEPYMTETASRHRGSECPLGGDNGEPRRLPAAKRAMRLSWAWFPVTMSTGSMAVLLSQQPFTFHGLNIIGRVVFVIDLVLFVIFSFLISLRFLKSPRSLLRSLHDPSECFFTGSFLASIALILYCTAAYGVRGLDGHGAWLVSALRVLFWIYFACATLLAVFQCKFEIIVSLTDHVIFSTEKLDDRQAVPAWVLPAYPFLFTGPLAAEVASTQPNHSAVQIIIAGITGQGLGWMLALLIYNVYFLRLIKSDPPPPSQRPGMYISAGPAAYTCAGLIALGLQARRQLPARYLGLTTAYAGDVWYAIAVAAGLFLWSVAIWFAILTTLSVLRGIKKMRFNLQWWASVFPIAGLTLATIQVGSALDSDGIKGVGSGLTILLCLIWLIVAGFHIRAILSNNILSPGKDAFDS